MKKSGVCSCIKKSAKYFYCLPYNSDTGAITLIHRKLKTSGGSLGMLDQKKDPADQSIQY